MHKTIARYWLAGCLLALLAACGGGGGGSNSSTTTTGGSTSTQSLSVAEQVSVVQPKQQ